MVMKRGSFFDNRNIQRKLLYIQTTKSRFIKKELSKKVYFKGKFVLTYFQLETLFPLFERHRFLDVKLRKYVNRSLVS